MSDFKSKLIKGFRKGLGYDRYEEGSFRAGTLAVDDNFTPKLPAAITQYAISGTYARWAVTDECIYGCIANADEVHWDLIIASGNPKSLSISVSASIVIGASAYLPTIFAFDNSEVVVAAVENRLLVSTNRGVSYTERTGPSGRYPTKIFYHRGKFYLSCTTPGAATDPREIWTTIDFITYTHIHTYAGPTVYLGEWDFFALGEYLFARYGLYNKILFQILETGGVTAVRGAIKHTSFGADGNDAIFFQQPKEDGMVTVYRFDGEFHVVGKFDIGMACSIAFVKNGICYFTGSLDSWTINVALFAYDLERDSVYFLERYFETSNEGHDGVFGYMDTRIYMRSYTPEVPDFGDDSHVWIGASSDYDLTAATLETGEIDMATHAPRRLVLRHNPLLAGHTVKVYVRFDRASAYTLILTSDTDGAVIKTYDWPAGSGPYDFVEFKIELQTTDTATTPGGVDLEYIYLPLSLMK